MTLLVIYDNIKETQGGRLDCPHNLHYVNTQTSQKKESEKTDFDKKLDAKQKLTNFMAAGCIVSIIVLFVVPIYVQFRELKRAKN